MNWHPGTLKSPAYAEVCYLGICLGAISPMYIPQGEQSWDSNFMYILWAKEF